MVLLMSFAHLVDSEITHTYRAIVHMDNLCLLRLAHMVDSTLLLCSSLALVQPDAQLAIDTREKPSIADFLLKYCSHVWPIKQLLATKVLL